MNSSTDLILDGAVVDADVETPTAPIEFRWEDLPRMQRIAMSRTQDKNLASTPIMRYHADGMPVKRKHLMKKSDKPVQAVFFKEREVRGSYVQERGELLLRRLEGDGLKLPPPTKAQRDQVVHDIQAAGQARMETAL